MKPLKGSLSKYIIRNTFDELAKDYAKLSNKYLTTRRRDEISERSRGLILETGSGCGLITEKLLSKGAVVACDISLAMVKEVKKKYLIPVVVADAESLPFKDNIFDSVINAECLYYLDSPQSFFDEAKRVLKKNGVCTVSSMNQVWFPIAKIRNFLIKKLAARIKFLDLYTSHYFYERQIQTMYEKAGFRQINSKNIIFFPFRKLNKLNVYLENTFLRKMCLCNIIWGKV